MFTEYEKHRLQTAGIEWNYSLYRWQSYFAYLLGRSVSLEETSEFLAEEAKRQVTGSQEEQWTVSLQNV